MTDRLKGLWNYKEHILAVLLTINIPFQYNLSRFFNDTALPDDPYLQYMYYAYETDQHEPKALESIIESRYGIDVLGNINDKTGTQLHEALERAPQLNTLSKVYIFPESFKGRPIIRTDSRGKRACGIHQGHTIEIFCDADDVYDHEIAHELHEQHPKKAELEKAWQSVTIKLDGKIASFNRIYSNPRLMDDDYRWIAAGVLPEDLGSFSAYGLKDMNEHIAETRAGILEYRMLDNLRQYRNIDQFASLISRFGLVTDEQYSTWKIAALPCHSRPQSTTPLTPNMDVRLQKNLMHCLARTKNSLSSDEMDYLIKAAEIPSLRSKALETLIAKDDDEIAAYLVQDYLDAKIDNETTALAILYFAIHGSGGNLKKVEDIFLTIGIDHQILQATMVYFMQHGSEVHLGLVEPYLDAPQPKLKVAAINYFAKKGNGIRIERIGENLEGDSKAVTTAAIHYMTRFDREDRFAPIISTLVNSPEQMIVNASSEYFSPQAQRLQTSR
ncbi:hypothetical protein H6504_04630 [Candidatus Woesearchaeota archaeon]|nr:hypothetical protein [Candidatus Woesearchaeota archaeon]